MAQYFQNNHAPDCPLKFSLYMESSGSYYDVPTDTIRGASDIVYQPDDQTEVNGYWYLRSLTGDANGPLTNSDSGNYNMRASA